MKASAPKVSPEPPFSLFLCCMMLSSCILQIAAIMLRVSHFTLHSSHPYSQLPTYCWVTYWGRNNEVQWCTAKACTSVCMVALWGWSFRDILTWPCDDIMKRSCSESYQTLDIWCIYNVRNNSGTLSSQNVLFVWWVQVTRHPLTWCPWIVRCVSQLQAMSSPEHLWSMAVAR